MREEGWSGRAVRKGGRGGREGGGCGRGRFGRRVLRLRSDRRKDHELHKRWCKNNGCSHVHTGLCLKCCEWSKLKLGGTVRQTDESRLNVFFSFFRFLVVSSVRSRFAAPPYHQLPPTSVRRFFCSRRVEFQRNASRKKLPSSLDACHLHGSLSASYYLVESADQIRRSQPCTPHRASNGDTKHP